MELGDAPVPVMQPAKMGDGRDFTFAPASASFRIAMIWASVNRLFRMDSSEFVLRSTLRSKFSVARISGAVAEESRRRYAISEWWLEPNTKGPGAHSHPEDDIFYVLEGTMSVFVGESWTHATPGSFVLVPGGVTHDFENRGEVRAGVLNFSVPGGFEPHMNGIAEWFAEHPPQDADA